MSNTQKPKPLHISSVMPTCIDGSCNKQEAKNPDPENPSIALANLLKKDDKDTN